jgi:2'-5' RNA ligase
MRLFLAIEIPDKVKQQLDEQLYDVRKKYPEFNWVTAENFHITVYFFGETINVDPVKKKIKDLLFDKESFYLYSTNIDVFVHQKLLMYLNFRREKKLESTAELFKNNFSGPFTDQKYVPHLTIGRGRKSSKQQYFALKKRMEKVDIDISFNVTKLILFESILTGKKPFYKKIASFTLLKN